MPTAYYPAFELVRVNSSGVRSLQASTTISVYNMTAGGTLVGTLTSDSSGVIAAGSYSLDPGTIVELRHGTYPLKVQLTLQATKAKAGFQNPAAYCLEDLYTPTGSAETFELWAKDDNDPNQAAILLGQTRVGQNTEIPFQSNIAKTFRIYRFSKERKTLTRTKNNFGTAPSATLAIPALTGGGSQSLFNYYTSQSNPNADDSLFGYLLPANTLTNDGDSLDLFFTGTYAANADSKSIIVLLNGQTLADGTTTTQNGGSWVMRITLVRTSSTTARTSGEIWQSDTSSSKTFDGKYVAVTGLNFATNQGLSFYATSDSANDVTLTAAVGKKTTAFTPTLINHALTATVTASSTYSGFSTTPINDNHRMTSPGSYWQSSVAPDITPQTVDLDFGSLKTVIEVDVFSLADAITYSGSPTLSDTFTLYGLTAFEILYWNGTSWVDIVTVTGNNHVWKQLTIPPTVTQKIRLRITGTTGSHDVGRLVELEAWGF